MHAYEQYTELINITIFLTTQIKSNVFGSCKLKLKVLPVLLLASYLACSYSHTYKPCWASKPTLIIQFLENF